MVRFLVKFTLIKSKDGDWLYHKPKIKKRIKNKQRKAPICRIEGFHRCSPFASAFDKKTKRMK